MGAVLCLTYPHAAEVFALEVTGLNRMYRDVSAFATVGDDGALVAQFQFGDSTYFTAQLIAGYLIVFQY